MIVSHASIFKIQVNCLEEMRAIIIFNFFNFYYYYIIIIIITLLLYYYYYYIIVVLDARICFQFCSYEKNAGNNFNFTLQEQNNVKSLSSLEILLMLSNMFMILSILNVKISFSFLFILKCEGKYFIFLLRKCGKCRGKL